MVLAYIRLVDSLSKNFRVIQLVIVTTVRLLTHVLCKTSHFFFQSCITTMSNSRQASFNNVMKDWPDKYHVLDIISCLKGFTQRWNAYVAGNLLKIRNGKMKHAYNKDKTRPIIL